MLGLHRGNLRTALVAAACLVGTPGPLSMALASAVVALGLGLHVASKGCLRQNRALAVRGPYRRVRHPFYLANLLVDLGVGIAAARPALVVVALGLWWRIYGASIRNEETLLTSLFGDAYRRYAARVPRLLPTRRPLPLDPSAEGFSWANPNLSRGSEYARVARILSILPLLWLVPHVRDATLAGASPWTVWGDAAAPLALLAALRALAWGLRQRFQRHRPLIPRRRGRGPAMSGPEGPRPVPALPRRLAVAGSAFLLLAGMAAEGRGEHCAPLGTPADLAPSAAPSAGVGSPTAPTARPGLRGKRAPSPGHEPLPGGRRPGALGDDFRPR